MAATFQDKQRTLFERKARLLRRETPSEKTFRLRLERAGVDFIPQKAFIQGGGYYFVDFYLPKPLKVCVEIDGGYHDDAEQAESDRRKDAYLRGRGFTVVRIRNEDVETAPLPLTLQPKP